MGAPFVPCPHCGQPIPRQAAFCPYCARSVRDRKPTPMPIAARRRAPWGVFLLVLALAILILGLWLGRERTVKLYFWEDGTGQCIVNMDAVKQYLPQARLLSFGGVNHPDPTLEELLTMCYQMAVLVTYQGRETATDEWGSFDTANGSPGTSYLLLFDSNFHLMAYFWGQPRQAGEGRWEMEVTLCDYDVTPLYERQTAAFQADRDRVFANPIPPEEAAGLDAAWYIKGSTTGRSGILLDNDSQAYYLWAQYTSPWRESWCKPLEELAGDLPGGSRWVCYLLLDREFQLLGYTMVNGQNAYLLGELAERT